VGYFRSAFPLASRSWSLSDRVDRVLGRFGLSGRTPASAYGVDLMLVAGDQTRDSMLGRVPRGTPVITIGPGVLQRGVPERHQEGEAKRQVIFVTQAFAAHGDMAAQERQAAAMDSVRREVERTPDLEFYVRPHPRDHADYLREFEPDRVLGESPQSFLQAHADAALVGLTSTLLFEWAFLGRDSYVFCPEDEPSDVRAFLDRCAIIPYEDSASLVRDIARGVSGLESDTAGVLTRAHRAVVLDDLLGTGSR
jgi:hypothetical protein